MIRPALTALMLLASGAAMAQSQTFSMPSGCTAYMTVQQKSCVVSHHFTCANDPVGHQQRVDIAEFGLVYVGSIDAEAQWISSFSPESGIAEVLMENPVDPASFSELASTGSDSYDFRTDSTQIGMTRYVGRDTLTGQTVTIDGVELQETSYEIRALDATGTELWRSAGNEFISLEHRLFLAGVSTIKTMDESWTSDDTPIEFIFPGEPGFLSATPKYGCGEVTSSLDAPLFPEGDQA